MSTEGQRLRWGRPPLALVLTALTGRLAGLALPRWVDDLPGGPGTTMSTLGADAWPRLPREETIRRRLRRAVASQVQAFAFELREVPVGTAAGWSVGDRAVGDPSPGHVPVGGAPGGAHGHPPEPARVLAPPIPSVRARAEEVGAQPLALALPGLAGAYLPQVERSARLQATRRHSGWTTRPARAWCCRAAPSMGRPCSGPPGG